MDPPPAYGTTAPPPAPTSPPSDTPPKYEAPPGGQYTQPPEMPSGNMYATPPAGSYPAQQQGYMPIHNQPVPNYGATVPQQTIIVRQTAPGCVPSPQIIECPNCHAVVTTETNPVTGAVTWLSAGMLCIFGCWLGCCLIPFCINDLQDIEHKCPNCAAHIGTYHRL